MEDVPGSNHQDGYGSARLPARSSNLTLASHLFPAPATPSKFIPPRQNTPPARTVYLSPPAPRLSPFVYSSNRYGESEKQEGTSFQNAASLLDSSAPPSQSLYDIVKPSDELLAEEAEGKGFQQDHIRRDFLDSYQQDQGWEQDNDGENWTYGDVVRHYVPPGQCNWVNIQYQTRLQAKKALSKNGKIIGDNMNLMVGVVDCNDKAWLQAGESSNKSSGGLGFPRPLHPPSQRQFPRTYKVDIFDTQRPPVAQNSMWGKFVDYIIGS